MLDACLVLKFHASNDYDIKNAIHSIYIAHFKPSKPVADTISPEMGAPTLRGGGANIRLYDFAKFSQKLHEVERIWPWEGTSKILLFRSATANWKQQRFITFKWN